MTSLIRQITYERLERWARAEADGEIRIVQNRNLSGVPAPVLCHKWRKWYKWSYLHDLSPSVFKKYKLNIAKALGNQENTFEKRLEIRGKENLKNMKELKQIHNAKLNEFREPIQILFKLMTIGQRKDWLKKNPNLKLHTCIDCGKFSCCNLQTKKCIHQECPGMCSDCFDEKNSVGFEICECCNRKQELECPICYDDKKEKEMVCGDNCSHLVCWKCYGMASKSNNKIVKCPMCRAKF
jgi:hypothetical protein